MLFVCLFELLCVLCVTAKSTMRTVADLFLLIIAIIYHDRLSFLRNRHAALSNNVRTDGQAGKRQKHCAEHLEKAKVLSIFVNFMFFTVLAVREGRGLWEKWIIAKIISPHQMQHVQSAQWCAFCSCHIRERREGQN